MAKYEGDIVGWFYRNGKRIPIRSKKTTKERRDVTRAELETAKRKSGNPDLIQRVAYGMDPEVNHDIVYSKDGKYTSGTYDESEKAERLGWKYEGTVSDLARKTGLFSDKPRNFVRKREPDKDMLRKNAKQRGATKAPRRSEGNAFGVPRQHNKSFLNESKARRHESYLHSQGAKNVQVTGSKDAFGQTQHRVEWDEPKRKKK